MHTISVFHHLLDEYSIRSVAFYVAASWFEHSAYAMECRNGLHENRKSVQSQFLAACFIRIDQCCSFPRDERSGWFAGGVHNHIVAGVGHELAGVSLAGSRCFDDRIVASMKSTAKKYMERRHFACHQCVPKSY